MLFENLKLQVNQSLIRMLSENSLTKANAINSKFMCIDLMRMCLFLDGNAGSKEQKGKLAWLMR